MCDKKNYEAIAPQSLRRSYSLDRVYIYVGSWQQNQAVVLNLDFMLEVF